MLSSFGDSFIPAPYVDTLISLQDQAPAQPFCYVRQCVETEIGVPFEAIFSSFDDTPLGAASIGQVRSGAGCVLYAYMQARDVTFGLPLRAASGQVHAATLVGTRHPVVVKVQYPDAKKHFSNDIRTLRRFCRVRPRAPGPQLPHADSPNRAALTPHPSTYTPRRT